MVEVVIGDAKHYSLVVCIWLLIVLVLIFWKNDMLSFKEKGKVVLFGDFNARVGKAVDVIGMIG